jgi:hypothetical protein
MICPNCRSSSTISFDREVHIVDSNKETKTTILYGCEECHCLFTFLKEPKPDTKKSKTENIDKVQSIFGNISKGCNKILANIK